jgi:hypothetical protein
MKTRILYFLLTFGLMAIHPGSIGQEKEKPVANDESCHTENQCFGNGEKITYKVYYNWNFLWLSAGEVKFEVEETENEYKISAVGRTYPSYEWFFKVRDYYSSEINKETLLPNTFVRQVQEGNYTLYDKIDFDQDNLKGTSFRGKTMEESKLHEFDLDNCIHDLLSIVYKMRNLDFEHMDYNASIPVEVFLDLETYPLDITMKGKDPKKWVRGQGYYKTIKISPELIDGNVFKEGQQMNIWVSDDENKVPLIIESPVSVGSIKVILKDYEGLKHPLNSKFSKK